MQRIILSQGRELNAFAIGEENAMHIVNVKREAGDTITVSALIGVCVSIRDDRF